MRMGWAAGRRAAACHAGQLRARGASVRPPAASRSASVADPVGAGGPLREVLQPGREAIVIGIDPDLSGALAVVRWRVRPLEPLPPGGIEASPLADAVAEVHDMPVETWAQPRGRDKRHPSAATLLELLRGVAASAAVTGAPTHAVMEYSMPLHLCGKYAWYGIGYSSGLLGGVLGAAGISHERVTASTWKSDLGLRGAGKAGSLDLARRLFPSASLHRKKDHGRAEALLIAAWGLGVRAAKPPPRPRKAKTAAARAAEAADAAAQ